MLSKKLKYEAKHFLEMLKMITIPDRAFIYTIKEINNYLKKNSYRLNTTRLNTVDYIINLYHDEPINILKKLGLLRDNELRKIFLKSFLKYFNVPQQDVACFRKYFNIAFNLVIQEADSYDEYDMIIFTHENLNIEQVIFTKVYGIIYALYIHSKKCFSNEMHHISSESLESDTPEQFVNEIKADFLEDFYKDIDIEFQNYYFEDEYQYDSEENEQYNIEPYSQEKFIRDSDNNNDNDSDNSFFIIRKKLLATHDELKIILRKNNHSDRDIYIIQELINKHNSVKKFSESIYKSGFNHQFNRKAYLSSKNIAVTRLTSEMWRYILNGVNNICRTTLSLRHGFLCSLSKDIPLGFANTIVHLDISYNKLYEFPDVIKLMQNLRLLNLNDNNIASIPGTIAQLMELKNLYLAQNKLREFPYTISLLANLRHLSITGNPLKKSCDKVLLEELNTLEIDAEKIKYLPRGLKRFGYNADIPCYDVPWYDHPAFHFITALIYTCLFIILAVLNRYYQQNLTQDLLFLAVFVSTMLYPGKMLLYAALDFARADALEIAVPDFLQYYDTGKVNKNASSVLDGGNSISNLREKKMLLTGYNDARARLSISESQRQEYCGSSLLTRANVDFQDGAAIYEHIHNTEDDELAEFFRQKVSLA